jgi:NADPH:quinone reductase-like Zn-dependent oxidoreductase
MSANRGVVVDPEAANRLVIREVAEPSPLPSEAVIGVHAISLNRGEVRMSQVKEAGWRPGWDFAGIVERQAADGSGPAAGTRIVGIARSGAWSERIAVPTNQIAALPDAVSFAQAATLPVAGLTALHALIKGGFMLEKTVLVTGATGGVGDFAMQLAKLAGARVAAHIRRPEQEAFVRQAGADYVPFALVVESVGGKVLADALTLLDEHSVVVSFGTSSGNEVTFNAQKFYNTGMVTLYGMILFDELKTVEAATLGLTRLAGLIAQGRLSPRISIEADWDQVADVARQLLNRTYPGKAVLHLKR